MRTITSLILALGFGFSGLANAENSSIRMESVENAIPHRIVYGFYLNNLDFGVGTYGFGATYLDTPEYSELHIPFSDNKGIFCGAAANGKWYAMVYQYNAGPVAKKLTSINIKTREVKEIGSYMPSDESYYTLRFQDMTYDYADETMYAVGFELGESSLFSVDLTTGMTTKLASFSKTVNSIAASYDGTLYAACNDGTLNIVDESTGKFTEVINTGWGYPSYSSSMEFDHTEGCIYWATNSYDKDQSKFQYLVRIDVKSDPVTVTEIGPIGSETASAQLLGLYIPFVLAGSEAPAAPTDLKIEPDTNGALKAVISWKNPEKNFGGEDLTGLKSVVIMRDNEKIAEIPTTENGKTESWVDETVPTTGDHEYTIYAVNEVGEGEKTYITQYVGPDYPEKVSGLTAMANNGCKYTYLSWISSKQGAHGLACDPEKIRYKVVRQPDNVVIHEDFKETYCIDTTMVRLLSYTYEVYAVNEVGESEAVVSNAIIAGNALKIPFIDSFSDNEAIQNQWTVVDYNEDYYPWIFSSGAGYYTFGDQTTAAEYYINPSFTPSNVENADEWLISPPIELETGKDYVLSFRYRCITDEKLTVSYGTSNTSGSQLVIKNLTLPAIDASSKDFVTQTVQLPRMIADGAYTIGFHLTTEYPAGGFSFIQLTDIKVEDKAVGIEANRLDGIEVYSTDNEIVVEGEFTDVSVYSIDGCEVVRSKEHRIPTSNFVAGVYFVKVVHGASSKVVKVLVK